MGIGYVRPDQFLDHLTVIKTMTMGMGMIRDNDNDNFFTLAGGRCEEKEKRITL